MQVSNPELRVLDWHFQNPFGQDHKPDRLNLSFICELIIKRTQLKWQTVIIILMDLQNVIFETLLSMGNQSFCALFLAARDREIAEKHLSYLLESKLYLDKTAFMQYAEAITNE